MLLLFSESLSGKQRRLVVARLPLLGPTLCPFTTTLFIGAAWQSMIVFRGSSVRTAQAAL
jgi:hypothetical protein